MFKIGDVVVCVGDSFSDGRMRDGKSYTILRINNHHINVAGIPGWWECSRFKLKEKEQEMNEIKWEGQSIDWEVGQEVFCLLRGKGVVCMVEPNTNLFDCGVTVYFEKHGRIRYGLDGKVSIIMHRSLFFSEPKIEAELFPPKKPFVPVLNKGDSVVSLSKTDASVLGIDVVEYENADHIVTNDKRMLTKEYWNFYKLGEQVKFS